MKTRFFRTAYLLSAFLLLLVLSACGGGKENKSTNGLSQAEIEEINMSSDSISDKLSGYPSPINPEALQEVRLYAESLPAVESADIAEGNLVVQYQNAGQEVWISTTVLPEPPGDMVETASLPSALFRSAAADHIDAGESKKAILINALKDDPRFAYDGERLNDIKRVLEGLAFDVEVLDGDNASPDKIRSLSGQSVIVYLGHGASITFGGNIPFTSPYALQTGKPWESNSIPLADWISNRIVKVTVDWGEERTKRSFHGITGRFWKDAFANSPFQNALFLNCACSSANEGFYRNLLDIGITAYTGWTKPTNKGSSAAYRMLAIMASGRSLKEAFDALPIEYKRFELDELTTELKYFPVTADSYTLNAINTERPEVVIWAPFQGENFSERQCSVKGQIIPYQSGWHTTIQVNGVSTALRVDSDGKFDQLVGLRHGENTIKVSAFSNVDATSTVGINGTFTEDVLFTSLWWNTADSDIDFHLVPIEGAAGARDDCYYGNKTSSWGATLDVDDVNGFGPEHITARTLPVGKYLLYVHYYSTNGQSTPSVVNVSVSTNGQQSVIFTLGGDRRMTAQGDRWNVCTVEFPSGETQNIDEFTPSVMTGRLSLQPASNLRLNNPKNY